MQVSWIEPDQLRDLVGQLQSPAAPVKSATVELHTLPDSAERGLGARELGIDDGDLWLPEQPLPAVSAPATGLATEFFAPVTKISQEDATATSAEIEEQPPSPSMPSNRAGELDRIRAKLQAIRERALGAGLLTRPSAAEGKSAPPPRGELAPEPPPPEAMAESTAAMERRAAIDAKVEALQTPGVREVTSAGVARTLPPVSPFSLAEPVAAALEAASQGSEPPGFQVPAGAISERLEAFAAWAERRLFLSDLIVVDDHGDILWGDHAKAGLVVSAMMACKAAMRSSALGAAGLSSVIEQPISADRLLVIVMCETQYGTLSIALVRDGSLTEADAELLRNALVAAVESQGHSPDAPPSGNILE